MNRRLLLAVAATALALSACAPAAQPSLSPSPSPTIETCGRFLVGSADAVGEGALPPIAVECLQGQEQVRLATLRGPLLIAVWASWCEPCSEELPLLQRFHDEYGDQVDVLGYNLLDVTGQAIAASVNWGVGFASLEDPDGVHRTDLGVTAPPTTLFVNSEGHVVYRHLGALTDETELLALIKKHLGVALG